MIDQSTIARILDAAQIVDVVSDFVSLKKRGVNYIGLCPFHNEKTPSFIVSPSKGICKCFGCSKGGNAVNFIMEKEQLNYSEALKYLAKKYNIEVVEKEMTAEELIRQNDRESMLVLNTFAQKIFSTNLLEHVEGKAIGLSYFRERGINDESIRKFQLGYALEGKDAFAQHALKNGFKKDYLIKTGLCIDNEYGMIDRFRGRVLFPVHSLSGKALAFGGRVLKNDDKTAKYVNSPTSEIYDKSNELYGIFFAKQAIVRQDECFLVEGYTDVISMHQAGIENVVASSGTSLTSGQIRLIHRFTPNIVVIYDGDAAGIKASIRGIDLLLEEGMNVKVLLLPDGEDPDTFARKQNASDFLNFVNENKTDFIRFKTKLLLEEAAKDPVKRAQLINDIVRSIALIPDNIVQSVYVRECSALLNVEEQLLRSEVAKRKREKLGKEFLPNIEQKSPSADAQKQQTEAALQEIKKNYDEEELNILRYIVRYGEKIITVDAENEQGELTPCQISIIEFVCNDLEADELLFQNPTHAAILQEAKKHIDTHGFTAERFFIYHYDPAISAIASDLASDKYVESKIHKKYKEIKSEAEQLPELVTRVIFEYKNKHIVNAIREKMLEIKNACDHNTGEESRLLEELHHLNYIKQQLAKRLGERIIVRI